MLRGVHSHTPPPPPCIWTNLNSSIMQVSPPEYKPEPEPEPECITFYFR